MCKQVSVSLPYRGDRLRMIAPRGKASLAREQLEGWWWPRICTALREDKPGTISALTHF
jgi:hypothetical protein